jgi:hypothetical protein
MFWGDSDIILDLFAHFLGMCQRMAAPTKRIVEMILPSPSERDEASKKMPLKLGATKVKTAIAAKSAAIV